MTIIESPESETTVTVGGTHGFRERVTVTLGRLTVFVGPNNSGKSRLLQILNQHFMPGSQVPASDYLPPFRFRTRSDAGVPGNAAQVVLSLRRGRSGAGADSNPEVSTDPIVHLAGLPNSARESVRAAHEEVFHHPIEFVLDASNSLVPPTPTVANLRPSTEGSGSLSVLTMLCCIYDPVLKWIFIDEPELGLEPVVQRRLMRLFQGVARQDEGLPHKRIALATHSHLFLDRSEIGNNRKLSIDEGGTVHVGRVRSRAELHQIVFEMLGNAPEDLFMPRAILIVEGRSDREFLTPVLRLLQVENVAIHDAEGDSRIGEAAASIDQMLKTTAYLPAFKNRVFVLCDRQPSHSPIEQWRHFLGREKVVELPLSGIEFCYPPSLIKEVTGLDVDLQQVGIQKYVDSSKRFEDSRGRDEKPKLGKFQGTKVELAQAVANGLTKERLSEIDPVIIALFKRVGCVPTLLG